MKSVHKANNRQVYFKLVSFIAVLFLLIGLTQIKLPQKALAVGFVPVPAEYRDSVSIDTINGAIQAILAVDEHGDVGQLMTEYETWKTTEGAIFRPSAVNTIGCSTEFINNLQINFTITHTILEPVRGTVKIEISNYKSGFVYDTKLLLLDFVPRKPINKVVKFSIVTAEPDTEFFIKITFPTAEELAYKEPDTKQVSLLEYLLYQSGITPH
jgi:hypothetical protein